MQAHSFVNELSPELLDQATKKAKKEGFNLAEKVNRCLASLVKDEGATKKSGYHHRLLRGWIEK